MVGLSPPGQSLYSVPLILLTFNRKVADAALGRVPPEFTAPPGRPCFPTWQQVQARIRGPLFALARYPLSSHSPPSASCPPSELPTPTRPPTKVNTEAARRLIKWPASASGLQQPHRSDHLSSHLPRRRQSWHHHRQPSTYSQRPSALTKRCNRH